VNVNVIHVNKRHIVFVYKVVVVVVDVDGRASMTYTALLLSLSIIYHDGRWQMAYQVLFCYEYEYASITNTYFITHV